MTISPASLTVGLGVGTLLARNFAAWFDESLDPVGEVKALFGKGPPKSHAERMGIPAIEKPDPGKPETHTPLQSDTLTTGDTPDS